jgi:hypothetical protein
MAQGEVTIEAKNPKARWIPLTLKPPVEVAATHVGIPVRPACFRLQLPSMGSTVPIDVVDGQELHVAFAATVTGRAAVGVHGCQFETLPTFFGHSMVLSAIHVITGAVQTLTGSTA